MIAKNRIRIISELKEMFWMNKETMEVQRITKMDSIHMRMNKATITNTLNGKNLTILIKTNKIRMNRITNT